MIIIPRKPMLLAPSNILDPVTGKLPPCRYVVCHDCRMKHEWTSRRDALEFFSRHRGHRIGVGGIERKLWDQWRFLRRRPESRYSDNANVKTAFGTATAFTKTNANLTNSVTAGWKGNSVDETSNLNIDALYSWELAAVNTAPANTKTLYCFVFSLIEGTAWSSSGDGTPDGNEGTMTYPSVTTLPVVSPLIIAIPYPVQNKAITSPAASVAKCFGGILPDKHLPGMVNDTGMTLSVTNIYYQDVYYTVA